MEIDPTANQHDDRGNDREAQKQDLSFTEYPIPLPALRND